MKVSGKMYLIIILKVTKNQGFTLRLEETIFEKLQGGWGQTEQSPLLSPRPPAVLGLSIAVEMTWSSNGNDKLKDWSEVKIINLVSHI